MRNKKRELSPKLRAFIEMARKENAKTKPSGWGNQDTHNYFGQI